MTNIKAGDDSNKDVSYKDLWAFTKKRTAKIVKDKEFVKLVKEKQAKEAQVAKDPYKAYKKKIAKLCGSYTAIDSMFKYATIDVPTSFIYLRKVFEKELIRAYRKQGIQKKYKLLSELSSLVIKDKITLIWADTIRNISNWVVHEHDGVDISEEDLKVALGALILCIRHLDAKE